MKKCKCVYFQTDSGRTPVQEFIDTLDSRAQQKYFSVVELLEDYGKSLVKPHASPIDDEIYELRFVGIEGKVRILYFFYDDTKAVLTNGFVKKVQRTPKNEIKLAQERRKLYFDRKK